MLADEPIHSSRGGGRLTQRFHARPVIAAELARCLVARRRELGGR
jgi:hypothetical protein